MRKWSALLVLACFSLANSHGQDLADRTSPLRETFREHSGVELVFERSELPPGVYHDQMVPLPDERRAAACRIATGEASKFPKHFLRDIGIKAVGVFDSCASRQGDGFRQYDQQLKGFRYFGIYNGRDAIAAAYYSDEQLPLTFHHEIFHHVDALTDASDRVDRRLAEALAGNNRYPAPKLKPSELANLKKVSQGRVLTDAVSEYAKKNPNEDKAETARYLMSALADSLVQVTEQPNLAGSQRILHVLEKYRRTLGGKGPTIGWFVDVALGRRHVAPSAIPADGHGKPEARALAAQLRAFSAGKDPRSEDKVRLLLLEAQRLDRTNLERLSAVELAHAAAAATERLLKSQILSNDDDRQFVVLGIEDENGVNWALRNNVRNFGVDAARLAAIGNRTVDAAESIKRTQLQNLRLVARFYVFIAARWKVTDKTRQIFEDTRDRFVASVAKSDPALESRFSQHDLESLADGISPLGDLLPVTNQHSKKIDAEINNPLLRTVVQSVQPACVQLGNGSGVNVSRKGRILTAAHVARQLDAKLQAAFPNGRKYTATCTAIDNDLDLAICSLSTKERLPFARVANTSPSTATSVVCIGQPGTLTPNGEPTGYQPFHISTGKIRGFVGDPLASQKLGGVKHDAWTYWGHSGSPLFNKQGCIVALHNSWDSETAMRHAVTHQAIVKFLKANDLEDAVADDAQ